MSLLAKLMLLVVTCCFSGWVSAQETFRCGQRLINEGDSKAEVEEHCGPPSSREGYLWIYDRGSEQFPVTIHFSANGTVNRIEETNQNL